MSDVTIVSYESGSNRDFSAISCIQSSPIEGKKALVAYTGEDADELHKIVTKQGYINEHDTKIIANTIDRCIEKINELTYGCTHELFATIICNILEDLKEN